MPVLKWVFKKQNGGVDWIDVDQDRDKRGDFCKHDNEPSAFILCWKFLD
jgi:hypothetical protein